MSLQQFSSTLEGKKPEVCIDKKELMLVEHYSYTN